MPLNSTLSDQELCILLKEEDKTAFSEIYSRYWNLLFLHAYKMLGAEEEAKDLVQELFISLWTKAADLDINTSLKGYLYTAVRYRVISHLRKKKANDDFILLIADALEEEDDCNWEVINERDLSAFIEQEINMLPPRMRQVFEMSRKDFMSHKEIAAKLGTSEETVKKQISKSIKVLRSKLGKYACFTVILIELIQHRH